MKLYKNFLVKCLNCEQTHRNFDFFMDLQLDLPVKKPIPLKSIPLRPTTNKTAISKKKEEINLPIIEEKKENDSGKFILVSLELDEENEFPNFDKEMADLYEPTFDLNIITNDKKGVKLTKLEECLENFFNIEFLTNQRNYYKCEECTKNMMPSST